MADWRQIQARIRKARSAPDGIAKMQELFDRTHDAMVAFELAKLHEKAGANQEAISFYTTAFERFRRMAWRKKAEEALVRLGAPVPTTPMETGPADSSAQASEPPPSTSSKIPDAVAAEEGESQLNFAHVIFAEAEPESSGHDSRPERAAQTATAPASSATAGKRGRRGRRGGRGRRRGGAREGVTPQAQVAAAPPAPIQRVEQPRSEARREPRRDRAPASEVEPGPISIEAALASRSKAGDPALASRSAKLESQLRRLVAAPPHSIDEHDTAPAGPGVLLLSDSDLSAYYYVEACATLRVALRILVQGQRGRERGESIRGRLAEHLDISESKVAKYLQEHCVVRWLQLDEGASHLAHFAIAMLQPALND